MLWHTRLTSAECHRVTLDQESPGWPQKAAFGSSPGGAMPTVNSRGHFVLGLGLRLRVATAEGPAAAEHHRRDSIGSSRHVERTPPSSPPIRRVCRRPLTRMNCLVITGKRYMQIGHRPGISGDCKLVPDRSRSINASPALRRLKSTPLGSVLCRLSRKLLQVGWSPRGPLIPPGRC